MEKKNIFWIIIIVILFISCIVVFNEVQKEKDGELIKAYAKADKIIYNPLTKKYSFGNYTNISEDKLKLQ